MQVYMMILRTARIDIFRFKDGDIYLSMCKGQNMEF